MLRPAPFILIVTTGLLTLPAGAADSVTIWTERAPSANGPWSRVDPASLEKDANGNPTFPTRSPEEFYRTRIERSPATGVGTPMLLADVPAPLLSRANTLLKSISKPSVGDPDSEGWPEDATFGPHVFPVSDAATDTGTQATYLEFKVVRGGRAPPRRPGFPVTPADTDPCEEFGSLLVSLSDADFPVAEFSTSGITTCELLAKLAQTKRIRAVRYGPGFWVAEDPDGKLLASLGSRPFKPDPRILEARFGNVVFEGDDDTGADVRPNPPLPDFTAEAYRTYEEFKQDYLVNPVYLSLRATKAARAKPQWEAARGIFPTALTLEVGESKVILPELPESPPPLISFVTEAAGEVLAAVPNRGGGILVRGVAAGLGELRVRSGQRQFTFSVQVTSPRGLRLPGDLIDAGFWYAGSWATQPHYYQLSDDEFDQYDWCDLVGCGPVAWAMLLAWFDREWDVDAAFLGEGSGDPPPDLSSFSRKSKVLSAYDDLHEYCDVICSITSDEGATWPGDMMEGVLGYTQVSKVAGLVKRKWSSRWTTDDDCPEDGALLCRDAIKKGYPAVVGLGWLWHYALAYGYAYNTLEGVIPGQHFIYRYLKCNMGWKSSDGGKWYNLCDTFFAADLKLTKGPNAP